MRFTPLLSRDQSNVTEYSQVYTGCYNTKYLAMTIDRMSPMETLSIEAALHPSSAQ